MTSAPTVRGKGVAQKQVIILTVRKTGGGGKNPNILRTSLVNVHNRRASGAAADAAHDPASIACGGPIPPSCALRE